jgi:hypothetical protein
VPPSPLGLGVLVATPAPASPLLVDVAVEAVGAPASAVAVMPFGAGFAGAGFAGAGFAGAGFAVCAETVRAAPGSAIAEATRAAKKAFFMVIVISVLSLLAGGLRRLSGVVEDLTQLLVE